MITAVPCVLAFNVGSSSIRFAVYEAGEMPRRRLNGKIDRVGLGGTNLVVSNSTDGSTLPPRLGRTDRREAVKVLLDWLAAQPVFEAVRGAGHRVVHGMKNSEPERVTPRLLAALHRSTRYAPEHLPFEVALIEAVSRRHPALPQIVCFDTAFHRTMPRVAKLLPIPRRYTSRGVERYGFHGLSYAYLMEELRRLDPVAAKGRVILAHLGNGASLAAVRDGKSIDTSMGFTPSSGLVMSSRSGDLDPGLAYYLARTTGMTVAQFQKMVNRQSGLLGVSGTSPDLRDLCVAEASDVHAKEAVDLFCYQVRKWIGSFAAALGGLDTLIFAGGIGENAPLIRERICSELGFLGIAVDPARNQQKALLISTDAGPVKVRVIPTDEELMIARYASRAFKLASRPESQQ